MCAVEFIDWLNLVRTETRIDGHSVVGSKREWEISLGRRLSLTWSWLASKMSIWRMKATLVFAIETKSWWTISQVSISYLYRIDSNTFPSIDSIQFSSVCEDGLSISKHLRYSVFFVCIRKMPSFEKWQQTQSKSIDYIRTIHDTGSRSESTRCFRRCLNNYKKIFVGLKTIEHLTTRFHEGHSLLLIRFIFLLFSLFLSSRWLLYCSSFLFVQLNVSSFFGA